MKYKRLVFGFLSAISIMVVIAVYALNINQETIISFEKGEKHFKEISTAASKLSSYAKRAEGHLLLYLGLHRKADKEKFPKRIKSLKEQILILDQKTQNPEVIVVLEKIKLNTENLLSMGNALISYHDNDLKNKGRFNIEEHRDMVLKLHDNFSQIRQFGVDLTEFEIKLESGLKITPIVNAGRLRFYILSLIALAFSLTVFVSHILIKMIKELNKEIASRILSEKTIIHERDKLGEALTKVKELSGLLPICSHCKKIRDDKGYWNNLEGYIEKHSDVSFSHSICSECSDELYGKEDWYIKMQTNKKSKTPIR